MIELGQMQELTIVKKVTFGVYLGDEKEQVLLPRKEVPEGAGPGDELKVFIYRDSADRLIATMREPLARLGKMSLLKVKQITKIGAFLDWGLEKDLLLPYKEQTEKIHAGQIVPVVLYIDKSDRLAATMHVYRYLSTAKDYEVNRPVKATVIQINPKLGAFLAVDGEYFGMIPVQEMTRKYTLGEEVSGRVSRVREDGKLDISVRDKAYQMLDKDADALLAKLQEHGGTLPFGDKSDPMEIRRAFGMSKAEFKRAIGHLLKMKKITAAPYEIKAL